MTNTVTMLKTTPGVNDGDTYPTTYRKGESYEIGDSLLEAFVDMAVVTLGGKPQAKAPEPEAAEPPAVPETEGDDQLRERAGLHTANDRETKVVEPEESKPAKVAEHKHPGRKPKH